jgi:hypothetical protein
VNGGPSTLRDLLDYRGDALSAEQLSVIGRSPNVTGLTPKRGEQFPADWNASASRAIGQTLDGALNAPIADLLVRTWNKYHSLLKYRNKAAYPADDVIEVTLADHSFKSTHEPRVKVLFNGKEITEVPFVIELVLTIDGARVKIQDGKILSVATGKCHSEATLTCGGAVLIKKTSKDFELPGDVTFKPAIAILETAAAPD